MTKIVDIEQSIIAANGNVSLAKELFAMLLAELNERLEQIENSVQENNMEMLAEHIHKLLGATAYCIVPKLRMCTQPLNDLLKQKDYSQVNQLIKPVIQEIKRLIKDGPAFIEMDWNNIN